MDHIDDLTTNDLAKLALPDHIDDAVSDLLREISRVGLIGLILYEEGRADGFCGALRLVGALDNAQEHALKKTLTRAIGQRRRELRPS